MEILLALRDLPYGSYWGDVLVRHPYRSEMTQRHLPKLVLDELRIVPVGTVMDALKLAFGD